MTRSIQETQKIGHFLQRSKLVRYVSIAGIFIFLSLTCFIPVHLSDELEEDAKIPDGLLYANAPIPSSDSNIATSLSNSVPPPMSLRKIPKIIHQSWKTEQLPEVKEFHIDPLEIQRMESFLGEK